MQTADQEYPFDRILPKINCPHCGNMATVNIHAEQGEIIDYFYECAECDKIIEIH